jgi:hypothetical protein
MLTPRRSNEHSNYTCNTQGRQVLMDISRFFRIQSVDFPLAAGFLHPYVTMKQVELQYSLVKQRMLEIKAFDGCLSGHYRPSASKTFYPYPRPHGRINQTGLILSGGISTIRIDYSWFYLPPALRAVKGSTPNVRLSHNNPQPCESWTGSIRLPVEHYGSIINSWRQLCMFIFIIVKVIL